jgi:hypothetical protein
MDFDPCLFVLLVEQHYITIDMYSVLFVDWRMNEQMALDVCKLLIDRSLVMSIYFTN